MAVLDRVLLRVFLCQAVQASLFGFGQVQVLGGVKVNYMFVG